MCFFVFFHGVAWRGFSNGSLPNCRSVVCITCLAVGLYCRLFATLLEAADGPLTALVCSNIVWQRHWPRLWEYKNCDRNYLRTRHAHTRQVLITMACDGSRMLPSCCSDAEVLEDSEVMRPWSACVLPPVPWWMVTACIYSPKKALTRQNSAPLGKVPKHCYPRPKVNVLTSAGDCRSCCPSEWGEW